MKVDWSSEARRDKRLAGGTRAGIWSRAKARRTQRAYLRRAWRRFAMFLLGWFLMIGLIAAFTANDVIKGVIIGAGLVTGPFAVWMLVVQLTGTAPAMMGDVAEQWTADELRALNREGWRLVNHFGLGHGDIDHLLVGPGGAFVFETKWKSDEWLSADGRDRQERAAAQVAANARRVRLWAPFKATGLSVRPVVVLWGGDAASLAKLHPAAPSAQIDDVAVVPGPSLRAWSANMTRNAPTGLVNEPLWAAILKQVAERDALELRNHPLPTSAADLALRGISALFTASVAFLFLIQVLQWSQSFWTLLAAGGMLVAGVGLARWRPARWFGWGAVAGGLLFGAAFLVLALISAFR